MSIAVHDVHESAGTRADARSDRFAALIAADDRTGVHVIAVAARTDHARTCTLDAYALLAGAHELPVIRGRAPEQPAPYGLFTDAFTHATTNPEPFTPVEQDANLVLRALFHSLSDPAWSRDTDPHRAVRTTLDTMSAPTGTVFLLDDVHHADPHSLALLDHLVHQGPRTPVVLVLAHDPHHPSAALTTLLAEAERHRPLDTLAPVVRLVDTGGHRLTQRELTVLHLLAEGLTADSIARRLDISPRTVHRHLQHLYRKLGTTDRLATVLHAKSLGLLP
ncbi:LuxR C-terminal-related transcriptional regulator [Umezawaea sp. Da 62-37]|uniref:helix-turn-helix transcriptional regulator n=1 Tax=Umezawaea sp. Da 62-37 TaxID=3075927 RepID=UPI0028F7401B|nr:LuxR C-terminal-related transcriptional regulator [Umezawaea sp. Da 62-37]WNV88525.1 LuxR C-terminal-related transcriptional regulator [Umezawaea sp. Da 62-37]